MNSRQPVAQKGVFAILFAVLLVVILALAGLAIDIGFAYERHGDMKNYANVAAIAAAHRLDGTAAGVQNAINAAEDSVDDNTWGNDYSADWDESALSFGPSADGPWRDASSVRTLPRDQLRLHRYARVDAGRVDTTMATVTRYFPFGGARENQLAAVVSVAGPVMTQMLPLAVCAMDAVRHKPRPVGGGLPELVEHGFRRGVTYNLLKLNPEPGSSEGASFLINPLDFPDSGGGLNSSNFTHSGVAPFVCSGSIGQPKSGQVYVQKPFPTSLFPELNSRFGQRSTCAATVGLPDSNVMNFIDPHWLKNHPADPHAKQSPPGGAMQTVADLNTSGSAELPSKADYGTLWAFARPVRFHSSAANHVGATFTKADFPNLYPASDGPFNTDWPDLSIVLPYMSTTSGNYQSPGSTYLRYRRILHVPLLECPVSANTATVLAVGRFFLTAAAQNDSMGEPAIPAEFGGLLPGSPQSSETRLYR